MCLPIRWLKFVSFTTAYYNCYNTWKPSIIEKVKLFGAFFFFVLAYPKNLLRSYKIRTRTCSHNRLSKHFLRLFVMRYARAWRGRLEWKKKKVAFGLNKICCSDMIQMSGRKKNWIHFSTHSSITLARARRDSTSKLSRRDEL